MVIAVWLHMYRVFLTGSYKPPREFNWVRRRDPAGADAAAVVYRLPAALGPIVDWAMTVGSNMAGAVPFLGHEGPGHQLLRAGGIDLITDASDPR